MHTLVKTMVSTAILIICSTAQVNATENLVDGEQIFRTAGGYGCSTCHGLFAHGGGNVGGNIRGKTLQDINSSLEHESTMKLLSDVLTVKDRQALAMYLNTLGNLPLVEWTIDDKETDIEVSIIQGTPSQLVIFNKLFEPLSLTLSPISSAAEITIKPYETVAVEWTPEPGLIELKHENSKMTIYVD
ncbi:c-type cytochrome [Vibrio breoganii]|jgi:cytochrome c2|uniref:c-type cytochrome n=1 Tax=Vibrio breoganii TaxID=553239 RepID=UPI000C82B1D3|nr:cytochrome c [Vibrio breoganii]PML36325.1 hypothetical protein BCT77_17095 [Vibrio breoganii]PMM85816.1 hypothetical protein BCT45_07460 [Vibrio breoganii]PMO75214.1 hypothetical protein BCT02_11920 [Vibrio breoganii]PMO85098.1 hypothetical protein BCS99_15030 [Vibrio breoganii]